MLFIKNLDYSMLKSVQDTPRRCYMYMGLCGVGLCAYSTEGAFGNRIKLIGNQVSERTLPYRDQTKEYFSWLISRNRNLLASMTANIKNNTNLWHKVQVGLTTILIAGLPVIVYYNRDSLVIIPVSLMNLGKNSLAFARAKLLKN